ncbi:MAG TPA: glycoside hydrolase family 30 beta sandwich domain-containing protein [Solirubrobacteraceae bacterium]
MSVAAVVGVLGSAGAASARRIPRPSGPAVQVVQTSANPGQGLTTLPALRFSSHRARTGPLITVDSGVRYQRFRGAGGALTDSSAWLIGTQLHPGTRAWLLRQLFGPGGINLNLIRLPIGASDFTAGRAPYSYDELPPGQSDPGLAHFSIGHDRTYILPVLRQALALAERPFILASLWSPPGWMKSNDSLSNMADTGSLLPADYGALAQYFVRFLQAYRRAGVPIQAITPQNEPGQQTTYPGLAETESDEAAFVGGDLAPALRGAGLSTRIFGFDSNWAGEAPFASALLNSPAGPALSGFATHCYYGAPSAMADVHAMRPGLEEIESECATGELNFPVPELEIASLREWATGVELWNLALNPRGGPVQPPNYGCFGCRGIVSIDPHTQRVRLSRTYYELGQLSRFVAPGAVRIASNNFVDYAYPFLGADFASPGLDDVAFRNPNGSEALVTYNGGSKPATFSVREGRDTFTATLPVAAMTTFTWRPGR